MTKEEFNNAFCDTVSRGRTDYNSTAIAEALAKLCCDGNDEALISEISVPLSEMLADAMTDEAADGKRALYTVLADINYRVNNFMI